MASWIVDLFGHVIEIKINAPRNYQIFLKMAV